jgi:hypothetical protein
MSADRNDDHDPLVMLAETENFAVFTGRDADGETIFNIELGSVTIHLFREEWDEFIELVRAAARNA